MKFELNDVEQKEYEKFYDAHEKCRKKAAKETASGFCPSGTISFTFTPTGVGTCVEVECNICHKKEDITDISSW